MRVVAYARVSTDEQAREGVSLQMQVERMRAYCVAHGHDLIDVMQEAGSGKTLDRPALTEALMLAHAGEVDAILVYKLDRLTRSVVDFGNLLEDAEQYGWNLLSVEDHLDMSTPTGRLVVNILVSVSQWERETIAERTREALASKRLRGERIGRPPVGYQVVDGELVPNGRYWIVELVKQMHGDGYTNEQIAAHLNATGVPTSTGTGRWHRKTVNRYLHAPTHEEVAA